MQGCNQRNEQGQVTILFAAMIMAAAAIMVALALVGQAVVHRARARSAADAVALAAVSDPAAADELANWYHDQGTAITRTDDHTIAVSGPSQAAAWAGPALSETNRSPAMLAMITRAEQLTDQTFSSVQWTMMSVTVDAADGVVLSEVAVGLGLCEVQTTANQPGNRAFVLCVLQ